MPKATDPVLIVVSGAPAAGKTTIAARLSEALGIPVLGKDMSNAARAKWLFGQSLAKEATPYRLPVVEPRPWQTLEERVLAMIRP